VSYIFSFFFQKIRTKLASRAEYKRIKRIRKVLQGYAIRTGINRNNNKLNNLWKI
jgi:hypothetical protein